MDGEAALPRKNGELVFDAPWQGRIFGMAVALNDQGLYAWDDFRDRLKSSIAVDESAGTTSSYYEQWLRSLEALLIDRGVVSPGELNAATEACAAEDEHDDHDHGANDR